VERRFLGVEVFDEYSPLQPAMQNCPTALTPQSRTTQNISPKIAQNNFPNQNHPPSNNR
jgi:hypothetical protein